MFFQSASRELCYLAEAISFIPRHVQRLMTGKLTGVDPGRPRNLQRRKVEVTR